MSRHHALLEFLSWVPSKLSAILLEARTAYQAGTKVTIPPITGAGHVKDAKDFKSGGRKDARNVLKIAETDVPELN
jgi:hypothetical protein